MAALSIAVIVLSFGTVDAGVQQLYVLDCGINIGKDQSRWSPGVNEGKSIESARSSRRRLVVIGVLRVPESQSRVHAGGGRRVELEAEDARVD
jgi:hypothetical protein